MVVRVSLQGEQQVGQGKSNNTAGKDANRLWLARNWLASNGQFGRSLEPATIEQQAGEVW